MKYDLLKLSLAQRALDLRIGAGRVPGRDLGLAGRAAGPDRGEAEEDDDAPRAGYRDRIVVAVVVGLILIMGGAYVALARGILWSLPIFALGFGLVLTLISFNQRYRHASPSLRRTIDFSSAFLNAALLAGILIVVNVIAFRYGGQPLDLTREQTYSLSSMTINQLVSLEQPVTFTMVFGRGPRAVTPARARRAVARVVQGRQSRDDPARQPQPVQRPDARRRADQARAGARDLARRRRRHRVWRGRRCPACRRCATRTCFIAFPLEPARGGQSQFASAFTGEDEITSALIRLREGKKVEGRLHDGARRAGHERLESARSRHRQLEGAAHQGRLRGDRPQPDLRTRSPPT